MAGCWGRALGPVRVPSAPLSARKQVVTTPSSKYPCSVLALPLAPPLPPSALSLLVQAGGRHDNDHADFRDIGLVPSSEEVRKKGCDGGHVVWEAMLELCQMQNSLTG